MLGLFGKSKKKTIVVVTLNARLQPMDRAPLEDALDAFMEQRGHGMRVVGGGTLQQPSGEIKECDIEMEVDNPTDARLTLLINVLESMLAPIGSTLHIPGQQGIDFGRQHGLAIYVNGTDLPASVYETCDINHVVDEFGRLLEGVGLVASNWQGPQDTALYIYGDDFETMVSRLKPFLDSYPLLERCRMERIA
ncbi:MULTISPECIES: hypothetical protein [Rhizobium]|uniref:Uncharacterized protein n=2 Tax=Rhizobium TaxID=379 RepID=A0A7Z0UAV4_9HYPH|nr:MULTISPECIES: hypothetical protein [Rhizobium]MBA5803312.1 hypothetical protein [Rhizobium changzhiense]MBB4441209.1 hypothetical protein [Rhizobium esperanzae]MCW0017038.1 hypothetical protein [Rhizobium sp. BT-226]MDH6204157.1 hypothetical protein [Rhizobium leguminosarum]NZD59745.1 hypothetical protein [Rhizobium changzhiense]